MTNKETTITVSGFFIVCIVFICVGFYSIIETKPALDPFANCVHLPSGDKTDYWACEKEANK